MRTQKGISLIVLIVTIIVMIIISGAIIIALIGNDGIITKAEDAAFRTDITMIKEKVSLKLMNCMMNKTPIEEEFTKVTLEESKTWEPQLKKEIIYWGQYDIGVTEITRDYANNQWEYILSQEGILDNLYFVDEEEGDKKYLYDINADIVYKVASTRVGVYKIHSIEELNVARGIEEVRTIKEISKSVTVDNISHYEPDLSGFALEKTSIVYYDENIQTSIEISAEEYLQNKKQRTIVKQIDTETVTYTFFNYSEQRWANILVEDSGIKSYWVWIPRYAYKISGNETLIEFIGLDNKPLNGSALPSDYIVHPAFGDNLKGIWVSKYEPINTPNQKVANFPHYIPDMTGFNPDNTYIEVYNSETESFEETKLKDIKDLTKFAKENNWFNYNEQVWANIKVVNPETKVESWWVWIPRYAYNITGNVTSIKFIDLNNNPLDGSTLPSNYIVHSAFGDDLKGIWASKYEPIQTIVEAGVKSNVNPPDMEGFNADNTYIECYNAEEEKFTEQTLRSVLSSNSIINTNNVVEKAEIDNSKINGVWYAYDKKIWANIKVVNPETKVESWWVWIPKYAYNITNNETKIIWLDKEDKPLDGSTIPSNYIIHSAFEDGKTGIWASKYEPIQK